MHAIGGLESELKTQKLAIEQLQTDMGNAIQYSKQAVEGKMHNQQKESDLEALHVP